MLNKFISIMLIIFLTAGCANVPTKHVYDDKGNKVLSIHSGKASDGIDFAHGVRAYDVYERNEYGVTTDKIVGTYIEPFVKEPFWARLILAIISGPATAAMFMGLRSRGGNDTNISNTNNNNPTSNSVSDAVGGGASSVSGAEAGATASSFSDAFQNMGEW